VPRAVVTKVGEGHAWSGGGGLDSGGCGSGLLTGSNVDYVGDIGNVISGVGDNDFVTLLERRSQGGGSKSRNDDSSGTHVDCVWVGGFVMLLWDVKVQGFQILVVEKN